MHSFLRVIHITLLADIGPCDFPGTSTSNVPRAFSKDPIWLSQGRLDLKSRGSPNLTSWGSLKMTSRGHPDLTLKGCPLEVSSGSPQDVARTNFFFWLFFQNLFDWPNLSESISTLKVYWKPCGTTNMKHFLKN